MEESALDELDYKILNLIANDTRMSFLEVSRLCNVSGAAVHQRVQKMIRNNFISGSEFKLNLDKIGYQTCTFLNLSFDSSSDIDMIIEKLGTVPEIVECHLTMGRFDLFVKVYAHNNSHLMELINRHIKPLGLVSSDAIVSYREAFRKQMVFPQYKI
jgi:Lrp/AsnC family transcriptional regulator for asnA, asnC and gidA